MSKDYLESLNSCIEPEIINNVKRYAISNKIPIIRDDGMNLILQLIQAARVKRVLELGSAIGYFALQVGIKTDAEVVTLEVDENLANIAKHNIESSGLKTRIKVVNADALDYDNESLGLFDLVFIDAGKSQYVKLFEKYSANVKVNGIVISDNLLFRGQVANPETIISRNRRQLVNKIRKYNEWLKDKTDYFTCFYDIGDGMAISLKK
ncbi:MAG: O-methyltransferase [Bacilli bacterium]|nr:O-methyltransferase [Bacilli bacterium]